MKQFITLICAAACTLTTLYGQSISLEDLTQMTVPNAVKFLPPPPDSLSMAFSNDVYQYMYGKTLRQTERGTMAWNDIRYGTAYLASRMSGKMGITISSVHTPYLYKLLNAGLNYIARPCGAAKTYYNRRRPFDRFNEPLFSNENPTTLKSQGSYPSAHSSLGWGAALILSEVNPQLQDELLEDGYQYGQSRVIVGAHWQSDVDAARMMSTAAFARLHSSEAYLKALALAQAEYDSLAHNQRPSSLDRVNPTITFLPDCPDSTGAVFAHDVVAFYQNKTLRNTERGSVALHDDDATLPGMSKVFSPILGISIDSQHTPGICQLLERGLAVAEANCKESKASHRRLPPHKRLNESMTVPTGNNDESCYPSLHATLGWVAALMMINICPTYQNEILNRGREYGQSRVILGTNWQSDVDAGQLLGGMVFSNLMSDPTFHDMLTQARHEYEIASSVEKIESNAFGHGSSATYTLDGRMATPHTIGIVITEDGKKLVR